MKQLVIKLKRIGRWRKPIYEVVVGFSELGPRSNKFREKLGFYSPQAHNKFFFINFFRLAYWLVKGARISVSAGKLIGKVAPWKFKSTQSSPILKNKKYWNAAL